ncbi:ATP-binding cassette domain-containing protein [Companilactobacillus huachuanensis]|uniref:ATP-binding cassette domain-containing protein n=1 Tax=Companilactobacillus huachuanensis TaxID=2559914 RepID=A0ABW1RII9_9LACO|nr:ATP-binding cassette domain-containing protein [Companilactobacillus huachuanensis]
MKIENFYCRYKKNFLFEDVNFYFEDCQLNFILGEKSIGKTTLLDKIADTKRGGNFIGFPNFKKIAYLAQDNEFRVGLTILEILSFVRQLNETLNLEIPEQIRNLLHKHFNELADNERKLVLIYMNLMVDKELYLFDEPDVGIGLDDSQTVFNWLREMTEEMNKTIIITTNKLDNICDIDNVNYIKDSREILADNYLKIKSQMAF